MHIYKFYNYFITIFKLIFLAHFILCKSFDYNAIKTFDKISYVKNSIEHLK